MGKISTRNNAVQSEDTHTKMTEKKDANEKKSRCFLFVGGRDFSPEYLTDLPTEDDYVIAADSGCETLEKLKTRLPDLCPNLILGDMDSFDKSRLPSLFPHVPFHAFPPEKDDTDSALAVDTALSLGYRKLYLIGGLGGRLDHTLNNVFLLEDIRKKGAECVLTDGKNRAYLAEEKNEIVKNGRKYVSLIPLDEIVYDVEMRGFFYPFKTEKLLRRRFVTVSNELTGDRGEISVGSGTALIVETV